jgi:predicted nucleic acid-binding protein
VASLARRDRLADWLAGELPTRFEGRILDIDRRIAETWGVVMARGHKAGLNVGSMDAFVAATVEIYRLTLVTRNVQHFESWASPLESVARQPNLVPGTSPRCEDRNLVAI